MEVGEDDFGGIEEVEGMAVVAAEEEGLGLHVDVGGVGGEGGHLVGEEDGGGVEVLAHAVPHHSSKLLHLFLPHFRNFTLSLTACKGFAGSFSSLCVVQRPSCDGGLVVFLQQQCYLTGSTATTAEADAFRVSVVH